VVLAELWLLADDPAESAAALAEAEALLAGGGLGHNDIFFHRALLERGLATRDQALLRRATAAFRRLGAPESMGFFDLLASLAEIAGGAAPDRGQRLSEQAGTLGYRWLLQHLPA
jgi:hypothetical protein